jgi:hypothetical protein
VEHQARWIFRHKAEQRERFCAQRNQVVGAPELLVLKVESIRREYQM